MSQIRMHQEKMIVIGAVIIIIAVISTLVYRSHLRSAATEVKLPPKAALSVTIGDKSVKPTMTVYTDPVCDRCAQFHDETLKKVHDEYVKPKKIKLEIRPLSIVSEYSAPLVRLMMCGNEQGKFWETSEFTYDAVGRKNGRALEANAAAFFTDFSAQRIAETVKLDSGKLTSCLSDTKYDALIKQADTQAYGAGIYSTPTTFIDKQPPVRGFAMYPYIQGMLDTEI